MQGISGIQSLMDDFLLFAGEINEAYKKTLQLLLNAVLNGWVFSNKKFRVSTRIEFCGIDLEANQDGQVVISPSPDRLSALLEFPSPTTKKEVKSLVGFLNTFSKYIPNVSQLTVKMRELTKARWASCGLWSMKRRWRPSELLLQTPSPSDHSASSLIQGFTHMQAI